MIKPGDKLEAMWSETFIDHVTKGKIYEIKKVDEFGYFFIINDKGKMIVPISTRFRRIKEGDNIDQRH